MEGFSVKCPKCSYTSFDYLKECKKCGEILEESRKSLNLKMLEPTLFTNFYTDEPGKTVLSQVEPAFTGTSGPENESAGSGFILENEFTAPDKTKIETAPAIDTGRGDFSDMGNLGKMDEIEARDTPKAASFNHASVSELDKPKVDTLDDLEFTSFDDDPAATESTNLLELDGLEIDDLDLFSDLPEASETASDKFGKDDSSFELNLNDAEVDRHRKNSDSIVGDGSIELELDMDDDKSLDDLLADLDNKS